MRSHANTPAPDTQTPLLGQGVLDLEGLGDLWLVWSEKGLVSLALPTRMPGEIEADMVDRGLTLELFGDFPRVCVGYYLDRLEQKLLGVNLRRVRDGTIESVCEAAADVVGQ